MFLRSYKRKKNGKWHEYFSVVENRRVADLPRFYVPVEVRGFTTSTVIFKGIQNA
jgi:hypothetical protein